MLEVELEKQRRQKWRIDHPEVGVRTLDEAREFLHSVGFCLIYPLRPPVLAPTFFGAYAGTDRDLPTAKQAFRDERSKEILALESRLLREKSAFRAGFGEESSLLIAAVEFPYFYALMGERNPKQAPNPGSRGEKALVTHAFEMIRDVGPITEKALRERLGETVSDVALTRVLHELSSHLRIVRVDEGMESLATWDVLFRWAPEVVNQGKQISSGEAISALVSKYLESCIAAEQKDVEEFFGHIIPRSRVAEVCKAMQSAREFSIVQVAGKTLLRLTHRMSEEEKAELAASYVNRPVRESKTDLPIAHPGEKRAWVSKRPGFRPSIKPYREKRPAPVDTQPPRPRPEGKSFEKPAGFIAKRPAGWKPKRREFGAGSVPKRSGISTSFSSRPKTVRPEGSKPIGGGWKPKGRSERPPFKREGNFRPARPEFKRERQEGVSGDSRKAGFTRASALGDYKPRPGNAGDKRKEGWKSKPSGKPGFGRPKGKSFKSSGSRPGKFSGSRPPSRYRSKPRRPE